MGRMLRFEIFYNDLCEEAQRALCEEFNTTIEEENWENAEIPLTIIEREIE